MSGILAVLVQLLPTLLPMILELIKKPKAGKIEYFENLKKAALHDQKAMLAFGADSLLCLANEWTDEQWSALREPLEAANASAVAYGAKVAAARAAGGVA